MPVCQPIDIIHIVKDYDRWQCLRAILPIEILEEIKRHEDTPDELVHDVFAETLWPGHPLGRSVIGRAEVIESLHEPPALVITDLRMPTMGGEALGHWVKDHFPGVPLLFISGFGVEHNAELPGAFLAKPFTNDALVDAVRAVLATRNQLRH